MNNFLELVLSTSEVSNVIQKSFDNFLRYFMLGDTTRDWGEAFCMAKGPSLVTGAYFTLGGVNCETDASVLTRTSVGVAIRTMSQCVRMMYAEDSLVGLPESLNYPTAKANTTLFDTSLDTLSLSELRRLRRLRKNTGREMGPDERPEPGHGRGHPEAGRPDDWQGEIR